MSDLSVLEPLREKLEAKPKTLILVGPNPNVDLMASALGLQQALVHAGIDAHVASPADMRVEFSRLVGVDQVKKKVANRNLIVSFPYSEDKVEKVSYNISDDGKRFNLVIAPKTGAQPMNPEQVTYDYAGADAELVFLFGVSQFTDLGAIYEADRNTIEAAQTVAFTLFPVGTFANMHVTCEGRSSMAECMHAVVQFLRLEHTQDSASNMLFGIENVTQGFATPTVTADTFETIATLLRAGAKRQPVGQHNTISPTQLPFTPAPQGMPATPNQFAAALNNAGASLNPPPQYSATSEFKG